MQSQDEIEYFLAIAEIKNLNHASKVLFVTPQALSMFLARLERSLGVTLFLRNKDSLQLTEAGRVYYEGAKHMAAIRSATLRRLSDVQSAKEARLRIGAIGSRAIDFIAALLPAWQGALPGYAFEVYDHVFPKAYGQLQLGAVDFAVGVLDYSREIDFSYFLLNREEIGLLIPEQHPLNLQLREAGVSPDDPVDISVCKSEPIRLCEPGTVITRTCRRYLKQERFSPGKLINSQQRFIAAISRINNSLALCAEHDVRPGMGVVFQRLKKAMTYDKGLVFSKNQSLSPTFKRVIEIAEAHRELF